MAHCPPELLTDVADILETVRTWDGVVEKKRGVFYLRRQPFLHFHLVAADRRRADVKGRRGWVQVDLPRPAPATRRRALLRTLRLHHAEQQAGRTSRRRSSTTSCASGTRRG